MAEHRQPFDPSRKPPPPEAALRTETESDLARLRLLLESTGEGLFSIDPQARCTFINKAAATMLGYEPGELLGRNMHRTLHHTRRDGTPYPQEECPIVRATRTGQSCRLDDEVLWRRDGTSFPAEFSSFPILDGGAITGAVVTFTDITQRKQAEEALRTSQANLAEAQHLAKLGSWELDLARNKLTWSDEIYRIFEIESAEFGASYEAFLNTVHPEDRAFVNDAYTGSVKNRTLYDIVHRLLMKDGRIKYVHERCETHYDENGSPLRSVGTVQDITEQRLSEQALRAGEQRLRAFVEAMPDIAFVLDEDGRYIEIVAREEVLLYSDIAALKGRLMRDVLPQPSADLFLQTVRSTIESGRSQTLEYELKVQAGLRWFEGRTALMVTRPGERRQVVWLSRDITERKRLEQQLRQAQKMDALGRLAGGVAHDLNNLLTVVSGYSEMLLQRFTKDDTVRLRIGHILQASTRATALTNQLLAFSRQQVLQPKVLHVNAVIEKVVPLLIRLIGEDIEVRTDLAPEVGKVKADPGQMEQVLMNLAANARDAMPRGGQFTIRTANQDLDAATAGRYAGLREGPYVVLTAVDTGIGMDTETLSHVFEPFFTTKEVGKGTGLGLATVHGIIEQSGGAILVDSEPGRGTTFRIFLPRIMDPTEPDSPPLSLDAKQDRGTETILLVEDEEGVRSLASTVLREFGYRVLEARTPHEGLRLATQRAEMIDALVTDIVMPGMSGRELADRLLQPHPQIKVLYMSGYTTDTVLRHGVMAEGFAFLQKPFAPHALVKKLRALLDEPPKA